VLVGVGASRRGPAQARLPASAEALSTEARLSADVDSGSSGALESKATRPFSTVQKHGGRGQQLGPKLGAAQAALCSAGISAAGRRLGANDAGGGLDCLTRR